MPRKKKEIKTTENPISPVIQKEENELPRSKLRGILASSASSFLAPSAVQQAGRYSALRNKKEIVKSDTVKKVKKLEEKTVKTSEKEVEKERIKKELKPAVYFAVGRRKTAVSRVNLYTGLPKEENKILVNDKPIEEYFPSEIEKKAYIEPFRTTNTIGRFKVTVKVEGSGKRGQLDACILGFARAIEQIDKAKFRPILKKRGLLTRDSRTRERRKVGTGGKARRKKQSPKR